MNIKKHPFLSSSLLIVTCLAIGLTSCVRSIPEVPLTQLQTREIQTREFDTNDTKLVMKSMMHVLQDDGYVIKNAVLDLGLLSAEKNADIEKKGEAFAARLLEGVNARWKKQEILEASANVSEFGNRTRVRINFQRKTMDNFGCPNDVQTILDEYVYQQFFNKVRNSLFIQQENI